MTNILDLIGNTPLMNIDNIYFKMEMMNPSGSIKDRIAKEMIVFIAAKHRIFNVIEATSGNTGVSIAMVCAALNIQSLLYVPKNTSLLKIKMMKFYGAKVYSECQNIQDCIDRALVSSENGAGIYLDQFYNPKNLEAQIKMAKEARLQYNEAINNTHWDLDFHSVDAIVAGMGTGGTLMGLHKVFPEAEIFTIHALDRIEGICDGVKTPLVDKSLQINQIPVTYLQAKLTSEFLAKNHGILCGISSGANYYASTVIQKKYGKILTVFPDSGVRYL